MTNYITCDILEILKEKNNRKMYFSFCIIFCLVLNIWNNSTSVCMVVLEKENMKI